MSRPSERGDYQKASGSQASPNPGSTSEGMCLSEPAYRGFPKSCSTPMAKDYTSAQGLCIANTWRILVPRNGLHAMKMGIYLEPSRGLLREVMNAHGGFAAWQRATTVRAVMSTGGVLFLMRTTRDVFRHTEVVVDLRSPHAELKEFPRAGCTGIFEPNRAWIEGQDGKVLAERDNPRASFHGIAKQLHWDDLDSVYFAGYAVWNYITAPYLLCRNDVTSEEGASCDHKGETWRGLTTTFPESLPTHNARQVFYFDERAYLRRHDYHAEVIGPYAVASHFCDGHQTFGKAVFPTRRRVVPRTAGGKTLPFPTLVWIQVHDAELETA